MSSPKSGLRAILAPSARKDIDDILRRSKDRFGKDAAVRYRELIVQAVRDVAADATRPGVRRRAELQPGILIYPLVFSRDLVQGKRVKEPRHLLIFRVADKRLDILRVLHDSQDLGQHLPHDI